MLQELTIMPLELVFPVLRFADQNHNSIWLPVEVPVIISRFLLGFMIARLNDGLSQETYSYNDHLFKLICLVYNFFDGSYHDQ